MELGSTYSSFLFQYRCSDVSPLFQRILRDSRVRMSEFLFDILCFCVCIFSVLNLCVVESVLLERNVRVECVQDPGPTVRSKKSVQEDNLRSEGSFDPVTYNSQHFRPYDSFEPREKAQNQVQLLLPQQKPEHFKIADACSAKRRWPIRPTKSCWSTGACTTRPASQKTFTAASWTQKCGKLPSLARPRPRINWPGQEISWRHRRSPDPPTCPWTCLAGKALETFLFALMMIPTFYGSQTAGCQEQEEWQHCFETGGRIWLEYSHGIQLSRICGSTARKDKGKSLFMSLLWNYYLWL